MADFGLDADAERTDQVDDLLRSADVFLQGLVRVINHDVSKTGADGARDGLRGLAVVQRDAQGNGGVRREGFDDRPGPIIAAILEVRFIFGDDERRLLFFRGLDDGAADVIAAAVVIESGDAETFGRGEVT